MSCRPPGRAATASRGQGGGAACCWVRGKPCSRCRRRCAQRFSGKIGRVQQCLPLIPGYSRTREDVCWTVQCGKFPIYRFIFSSGSELFRGGKFDRNQPLAVANISTNPTFSGSGWLSECTESGWEERRHAKLASLLFRVTEGWDGLT